MLFSIVVIVDIPSNSITFSFFLQLFGLLYNTDGQDISFET